MRVIGAFLLGCLVAIPLLLLGAVFLAIEDKPAVDRATELRPEHIERAKRIFDRNDPRRLRQGEVRTILVARDDLDVALNYLANRFGRGSARVELRAGVARLVVSMQLPRGLPDGFVNVDAELHSSRGLPRIERLRIGRLPLPAWLANAALAQAAQRLAESADYRLLVNTVTSVEISSGNVSITYRWSADIPERARARMIAPQDAERMRRYQERLAVAVGQTKAAAALPLSALLPPLFTLADSRSGSSDAIAENRALILILAFFVNGRGLDELLPAARDWPQPAHRVTTLSGRDDFPKHFIISAALAAFAGEPLADAIGVYKEIDDARGGSGFSFNDIAADRAGSRFGELAVLNAESARRLQQLMKTPRRETDLMPATSDLPEFMPEAEFKRRFGGVDAPAYRQMMAEIERRSGALPFNSLTRQTP